MEMKDIFSRHELRVSLEKPEVLRVGQQSKSLDVRLDKKKVKQRCNVVYLSGAVYEDGDKEAEIRRRRQAGVMEGRHKYRKLKGKLLSSCVATVYLCSLETFAMAEKNHEKQTSL